MAKHSTRRSEGLTKDQIIAAAVDILDDGGEAALTFRALSARLATGSGAIYWHVADKQALLAEATDHIVAAALPDGRVPADPRDAIRAIALSLFDAIDDHPWLGTELSGGPWHYAVLRILEAIGAQIDALGVVERDAFNHATALLSFILGLAGQYGAASRQGGAGMTRTDLLTNVAAKWAELDAARHPFVRRMAVQLAGHDDRKQFLAGIDLILGGIVSRD